jgi:ribose transport system substrate-binding protein
MQKLLAALWVLALFAPAVGNAQNEPPGISVPTLLPAFDASRPRCAPPPNVRKVLAFAQDNQRAFMQGVGRGLAAAAHDRGLGFEVALADNDPLKMIDQLRAMRASGVGAVVAAPVDPESLAPALQALIWAGTYVGTIVPPPATSLLNAPQYLTGKALADTAVAYINAKLGGKARVVLLTQDHLQFLAPRFVAMRDALAALPGVTIVADISPVTVDLAGGRAMMETILLAHPNIDVVLGADTVVLGALAALREAGKARPDQFLGGIDGEPDAVTEIRKGNGPYKASVSLAAPIFAYAMGQQAADWLDGKTIPQAMDILPLALTAQNLAAYETDTANPGAVYADPARRAAYLKMYGNICYDTRDQYINFAWSSERK